MGKVLIKFSDLYNLRLPLHKFEDTKCGNVESYTNVLVSGILELSLKGDEFGQKTEEEEFKPQQGRRT